MDMVIDIKGLADVIKTINRDIKQVQIATELAVHEAAEKVKNDAQLKTPVDTGNLRSSAYVAGRRRGNLYQSQIGFLPNYAVYVHEDLTKRHNNGENKFLEKALLQNQRNVVRIIQNRITKILGR